MSLVWPTEEPDYPGETAKCDFCGRTLPIEQVKWEMTEGIKTWMCDDCEKEQQ